MAKKNPQQSVSQPRPKTSAGLVKASTMYAAVAAAFLIGAFAGVTGYGIYKADMGPEADHAHQAAPQGMPQGMPPGMPPKGMPGAASGPTPDQARQLQSMEALAAKNPNDPEAWTSLGNLYFDTEQPDKAIPAYQKALALKPDAPDVWTDLGVMYRTAGKFQDAVGAFDKAIALDPKHEIARFNKGIVYLHDLRDRDKAAQAWDELLKVNPAAKTPGGQPVADLVRELKAGKM
jgi:cytochrome c-type biogenesis protein CcmH/NrfG